MKRKNPWFIGFIVSTLMITALAATVGLRYAGTGDALILKTFAGYQGGVPASYHAEVHTALSWLLYGLHTLAPSVAWFSWLQIALLWLSACVIVKAMVGCARNSHLPRWLGAIAGMMLLVAYALFAACRIDHDLTAAMLGAAAVAQLCAIPYLKANDKQVVRGMVLSIVLALLSYCLYPQGAFVALSMWAVAALCVRLTVYSHKEVAHRGTQARNGARGLAIGVFICVFSVAVFVTINHIQMDAMREYTAWQSARAALFANKAFPAGVTDAMLETVGWTRTRLELIASGYLYDTSITAHSMTVLNGLLEAGTPNLQQSAVKAVSNTGVLLSGDGSQLFETLFPIGLMAVCYVALLLKRLGRLWLWLTPLLAAVVCVVWLAVLGVDELLPAESLATLAPTATLMCAMMLGTAGARPSVRWHDLLCGLLAVGTVALALYCGQANLREIRSLPVSAEASAYEEALTQYALSKPDKLIFYQTSLVKDTRLFPDLSQVPSNIVLPDMRNIHSAGYNDQLDKYGLDSQNVRPRDFLNENVLVAGTQTGAWRRLMPYVNESVTGTLNWALYEQTDGVYAYRLCRR